MTMLRERVNSERGSALVTALLVLAIMMTIALPLMSVVDTQQRVTTAERMHESTFSLTDAVLNTEVFVLSQRWPASADDAYPTCTQESVSLKCPDPGALANTYTGPDFSKRAWTVQVRDDGSSAADYYDEAIVNAQPAWDANANGRVWVRADARGAGPTQSLVAQVKMTEHVETFPRHISTSGYLNIKHIHKKSLITQTAGGQPAPLVVRCTGAVGSTCLNYKAKKKWTPPNIQTGYVGNAVPPAAIDGLRQRAKMLGTYYDTCPPSPVGELVFVEHGDCVYDTHKMKKTGVYWGTPTGKKTYDVNSAANPGAFVVANGGVTLTGHMTYYGLVYAANLSNSTAELIKIQHKTQVRGSIAVDGAGGVNIHVHGPALTYDPTVFWDLTSLQGATIVQGSWHEL